MMELSSKAKPAEPPGAIRRRHTEEGSLKGAARSRHNVEDGSVQGAARSHHDRAAETGDDVFEFSVEFGKSSDSKLGLTINKYDHSLRVDAISEGLIADRNRRHPRSAVQPGDMVVEVNGICGGDEMVTELKAVSFIKMLVRRYPGLPVNSEFPATSPWRVNDAVDYWSTTHKAWLPTRVTFVKDSVEVAVELRPKTLWTAQEAAKILRVENSARKKKRKKKRIDSDDL